MIDMGVHASFRDESEQVDALATLERSAQRRIFEERATFDRVVHALKILVEPSTRTDGQVAYLRVAHLTRRKTDGGTRRIESRVRVIGPQLVEHRGVREFDSIARAWRREPPAVKDDDRYEWEAA
mgnify:CR=1 FL=1